MKITMIIPDNTVIATVSLATQDKANPQNIRLGVLNICSDKLTDGNTVDLRPKDEESEDIE